MGGLRHLWRKTWVSLPVLALVALQGGCAAVDAVKDANIPELVGLAEDEPCVLTPREGRKLAGAYLRQPKGDAQSFDVLFVSGKESRSDLPRKLELDDRTLRRLGGNPLEDGLRGSSRSTVKLRPGFRSGAALPNVYDLGYRAAGVDYGGTLVIGSSPAEDEIPTGGAASLTGRIVVDIGSPTSDGQPVTRGVGRFTLTAGYGAQRGNLNVDLSGAGLPFTRLSWTNLYLCGARFVSSGQGQVLATGRDGRTAPPFQTPDGPTPLKSQLEAVLIAAEARPAPPQGIGGVFAVQSDLGSISAVFLSDQPQGAP